AALDDGERRFRRPQQMDPLLARGDCRELARKARGGRAVTGGNDQTGKPPERRISRALPRVDFTGIERLAVAGDERLHHRMFALMGLQIADAAALVAASAADHLAQELPGALGGARIAIEKAQVRIDDPDQVEA